MHRPSVRLAVSLLAALALTVPAAPAGAVTSNFCDFPSLAAFQLEGTAQQGANDVLELTKNSGSETGAAWLKTPIPLPAGASVHTYFRFQISPNAFLGSGDGLTFTLQSQAVTALGNGDQSLGYGNDLFGNGADSNP